MHVHLYKNNNKQIIREIKRKRIFYYLWWRDERIFFLFRNFFIYASIHLFFLSNSWSGIANFLLEVFYCSLWQQMIDLLVKRISCLTKKMYLSNKFRIRKKKKGICKETYAFCSLFIKSLVYLYQIWILLYFCSF